MKQDHSIIDNVSELEKLFLLWFFKDIELLIKKIMKLFADKWVSIINFCRSITEAFK